MERYAGTSADFSGGSKSARTLLNQAQECDYSGGREFQVRRRFRRGARTFD